VKKAIPCARPASKRDALFFRKDFLLDSLYVLPILFFSIVVHEVAHGWAAYRLGDPTAHDAGRLTFNPLPHIDPFGSVILPLLLVYSHSSFFIGWAKPVPVNPMNFRHLRRDDILVSAAGPFSNLLMACCCAVFYIMTVHVFGSVNSIENEFQREMVNFMKRMFEYGIPMNIFLALFNLIPVPPLDGSHVLASLLPQKIGEQYRKIGFFGIIIVIMLMRIDTFNYAIESMIQTLCIPFVLLINICT
jgi:Zn-dependent protease